HRLRGNRRGDLGRACTGRPLPRSRTRPCRRTCGDAVRPRGHLRRDVPSLWRCCLERAALLGTRSGLDGGRHHRWSRHWMDRQSPFRDRRVDILPLTQAFLAEFGRTFANPPAGISREAKQMLLAYHWPGNIRELRNILERAAILCDGGLIT